MAYAIVTGASKGIGKAISEELASRHFDVLLIARSHDTLKEMTLMVSDRYHVKSDYLAIDLSSPKAAQEVYDWCKEKNYTIQVLVNNAGYGLNGAMDKYAVQENIDMIHVNIISMVSLTQIFLDDLRQQPEAYILNISSTAAYHSVPFLNIYAASKAFILSFSRGLNHELNGTSVSVTCVNPGATDTGFVSRAQLGQKLINLAKRVNMSPEAVAKIAVKAMLKGKNEIVVGMLNKFLVFCIWILPKYVVENIASRIFRQ